MEPSQISPSPRTDTRKAAKTNKTTGLRFERTFTAPEVMVPFQCDVHSWMNAYVGVLEHPYFAVTSDDGKFDISSLPPGDYVVEAWHEELGTQTQNITVGEGATAELNFTFTIS